ncbi:uncharacterized protein LOC100897472 [Galendromus occidentalis]|uniref:Uncharacterized protein LOC100897472 n=1 Tax=Galendromus occidentalis TaxID=34638 RepID=A0AAJ6QPX7_9ACAR|nr:uncharacterized protein LOC100897472 [Galendromus occidentalis]
MSESGDGNDNRGSIQAEAPRGHDVPDGSHQTFALSDPEAIREAELSQRYGKMNIFQKHLMEIIFMFFMFSSTIITTPRTQIFLEKACVLNLHLNDSICDRITNVINHDYYVAAARITKTTALARDIVSSIPGAICSVIAGQYMTRYGAKLPLILAVLGSLVSLTADLYTFIQRDIPLYVNIFTAIPQALTGGIIVFMTAIFSSVTWTCPSEERKERFLMIQFFIFLPMLLGTFLGGYVEKHSGVACLAALIFFGFAVSLAMLLWLYEDTAVSESARKETLLEAWRHSTSLETFKMSYSFLKRKRPGHAKIQIISMVFCLILGVIAFTGTADLDQLYVTQTFGWSSDLYGVLKAVVMLITFVLSIPSMLILTKVFKFSDPMLVTLGFASVALKAALMSVLSLGVSMFIIPSIVGLPFIVGLTAVRSHISRLLEVHEVAVVFALISACESLVPAIADIGVTAIYNSTLDFFPGLVYLVEGVVFLIPMAVAFMCYRWTQVEGYPNYKNLNDEVKAGEES